LEQNWAQRVLEHRHSLSRRELVLIDYISSCPQEAAFLKQSELCAQAGVSKPVVISCFRRLGYSDYQRFLEALQGFYAGQIDSAQASRVALRDVTDVASLVSLALDVETATLETLRRQLDLAALEALATSLIRATTVAVLDEGTGALPARYLVQRLRRCGLRATLVGSDGPHLLDDLEPLGPGDLLLTFGYTQDDAVVRQVLTLVRHRGAQTALITGAPRHDLFPLADHHLFVPRGQWNFKNSMAAPMAFAHLLLLVVELLGGEGLQIRLKDLESVRRDWNSQKKEEAS
jgi:DNA-binding MurR/RpiR family transcriptional regulator